MIPWKKWRTGFTELIFPRRCTFCRRSFADAGEAICPDCLLLIPYLHSPLCSLCGRELPDSSGGDHLCGSCLRRPPVYAMARAVVRYQEPVSHLLHRLKYTTDTQVLPALSQIIAPFADALQIDFHPASDRVIPVPLFSARLRKRGINQSLLLARLLFPTARDAILVDTLLRTRNTPPQTTLDGVARRKNLRAAFAVNSPETIMKRRIFLVDDVFTTGTTASECARALLAAGAREVCVITVARVADYR